MRLSRDEPQQTEGTIASLKEFRAHGVDPKAVALDIRKVREPAGLALLSLGEDKLSAGLFNALGALLYLVKLTNSDICTNLFD
jgi:hypothetical protein